MQFAPKPLEAAFKPYCRSSFLGRFEAAAQPMVKGGMVASNRLPAVIYTEEQCRSVRSVATVSRH